jgi:hypothetical protein
MCGIWSAPNTNEWDAPFSRRNVTANARFHPAKLPPRDRKNRGFLSCLFHRYLRNTTTNQSQQRPQHGFGERKDSLLI